MDFRFLHLPVILLLHPEKIDLQNTGKDGEIHFFGEFISQLCLSLHVSSMYSMTGVSPWSKGVLQQFVFRRFCFLWKQGFLVSIAKCNWDSHWWLICVLVRLLKHSVFLQDIHLLLIRVLLNSRSVRSARITVLPGSQESEKHYTVFTYASRHVPRCWQIALARSFFETANHQTLQRRTTHVA